MPSSSDSFSLLNDPPFTAADRMLVAHLREDWGESDPWILLAAALCSLAAREGHAYFNLAEPRHASVLLPRNWPSPDSWSERIAASPVARSENDSGDQPLILCETHALYLEKYYRYEQDLATLIRERSASPATISISKDVIQRALDSSLFVITGGPGTGKTTLALGYLNTLLDRWIDKRPPRIAAVAPTGKAAARLAESIASGIARLELSETRQTQLRAIPCLTIHRLLGTRAHRSSFRHDARNPIYYDALVIDESSMVDLPLMLRLFQALPPRCQVLLLGDKDQLASVDVGSVLSDLLEASTSERSPLHSKVERLTRTYRFREDSSIFRACQYARNGDAEHFTEMLAESLPDFSYHAIADDVRRIPERALKRALTRHEALVACDGPESAIAMLNQSIVLTPTRNGPFGSVQFNLLVEQRIQHAQSLPPNAAIHARPIIVLENDYELELFNGDLGIAWGDGVYFPSSNGSARRYRLNELPRHESAFALTIHKSQGSEFTETIALFGPSENQLITRELLYTAFSRAKESLILFANAETLTDAIARQATRATRLAQLLK